MENVIIVVILAVIVGAIIGYLLKSKRRAVKCIGCPDAHVCQAKNNASGACGGCQSCHNCSDRKE